MTSPRIGVPARAIDMQYVMYLVVIATCFASYLVSKHWAPQFVRFLPELFSAGVAIYVLVEGSRQRFRWVHPRYWLVFLGMGLVLACGAIANDEASGPILSGMRYYLRCMPFFFVPAIWSFDERQLVRFLKLLAGVSLLQVPIAIQQRFSLAAADRNTGDLVYGSLMLSGTLTLFLICVIAVMAALMMRQHLSRAAFAILFGLLLIPMSINETKITAFLLPPVLLATILYATPAGQRMRAGVIGFVLLVGAGAIFVPLYDYYSALNSADPNPERIEDYFTKNQKTSTYLDTGAGVGTRKEAGRVDSVVVPLRELSRDPVKLALGLGIGNASASQLGTAFTGRYYRLYGRYGSSLGTFLLETGLFGVGLIALLHAMILIDSLYVAQHDSGLFGALAVGWMPVVGVATLGLFYLTLHVFESFSYLFWFFSGCIAAQRMRMQEPAQAGFRPQLASDFAR